MTLAKRANRELSRKAFGETLDNFLVSRRMRPIDVANSTGKSPSYVTRTMQGTRTVSPEWVNEVADVLGLNPEQTRLLHTMAAIDAGYKLDLTKK